MNKAKIVGIISVKGGVGKTTVALNTAAAMSHSLGKRVLLVDANFTTPHVGLSLGLVNPCYTLHEVLAEKISPFDALHKYTENMYVLPGGINKQKTSLMNLKEKLKNLTPYFDCIILDSAPTLNEEMASVIAASDSIVVVTSPDHITLSSTLHAISVAKKRNVPIKGLVLNKIKRKNFELSSREIEKYAQIPVIAALDDNAKMQEALSLTKPLALHSPKHSLSKKFDRLAAYLTNEEYTERTISEKIKNSLKNSFALPRIFLKGGYNENK